MSAAITFDPVTVLIILGIVVLFLAAIYFLRRL